MLLVFFLFHLTFSYQYTFPQYEHKILSAMQLISDLLYNLYVSIRILSAMQLISYLLTD